VEKLHAGQQPQQVGNQRCLVVRWQGAVNPLVVGEGHRVSPLRYVERYRSGAALYRTDYSGFAKPSPSTIMVVVPVLLADSEAEICKNSISKG
jgi:hypothetical protein